MYVCFQALKSGWKAGLMPLIGLDGTFLKENVREFYWLLWHKIQQNTFIHLLGPWWIKKQIELGSDLWSY
ncbi:hypothetical protein RDI58_015763 [Solanum bulbocastanum]|uniref:Uncharacterized protein n=1 Tax=Solanum bulbocastanum TaxID=147425 RepID=A0AAN8TM61_SOLBU